jgi:hypothetical protein
MSSNYPNGFAAGVTIRGVPLLSTNPGEVFWVNGSGVLAKGGVGGSHSNDGSYRRPLSSIDYAVGKCTAGRGDIIVVMPGHSEDIGAASALDVDVAGVAIIGLGAGSLRPDLNFSATAGTVDLAAADCTLYNLTLTADVSGVVVGVNVDADGCTIDNCEFNFNATGDDFKTMIDADAVSNFALTNSKLYSEDNVAGGVTGVRFDTVAQGVVQNNYICGEFSTGALVGEGAAGSQTLVADNYIYNADTAGGECIEFTVADTGMCVNNICGTLFPTNNEAAIDPGSMLCAENYVVNAINESAILIPAALST